MVGVGLRPASYPANPVAFRQQPTRFWATTLMSPHTAQNSDHNPSAHQNVPPTAEGGRCEPTNNSHTTTPNSASPPTNSRPAAEVIPPKILSTLNEDGSRKWIKPRVSHGRFWTRRRAVAYLLIAIFTLIPYININAKPAILLDIVTRRFTFFGHTFLPTDTLLLALLVVGIFLGIFLITALLGRVWCGWACPQTVYMEFVYRPLQRFFEGAPGHPKKTKGFQGWLQTGGAGTPLKYLTYFIASCFLAHTFLAYFVGVKQLATWVTHSPFHHPTGFLVMAFVTAAMMFDFAFFREQTCLVACPYGRFQSVLLDRQSLIVSYDSTRGEPRGKTGKTLPTNSDSGIALPILSTHNTHNRIGDCVDCRLCVTTCPTGIDIRNGLQMECIHCAQCIDACDAVMTKLSRPTGLIRYSSKSAMAGTKPSLLRPRVIIYPLILTIIFGAFITILVTRDPSYISIRRGTGAPFYTLPTGEIANPVRFSLINRSNTPATYSFASIDEKTRLIIEDTSVTLAPSEGKVIAATVAAQPSMFRNGHYTTKLRVNYSGDDTQEHTKDSDFNMMGPGRTHQIKGTERDEHHESHEAASADNDEHAKEGDK